MSSPAQSADAVPALSAADRNLIEGCLLGTPGAWDAFIDRFAGLFAFVVGRTARQRGIPMAAADRDDLVAEILLECLRNDSAALRAFAGRASLPTYLTVIARRVAVRGLLRAASTAPRPQGRRTAGRRPRRGRADRRPRTRRDAAGRPRQRRGPARPAPPPGAEELRRDQPPHGHAAGIDRAGALPRREKMRKLEQHPQAG